MIGTFGWRSQGQCRRIGLQMKPIELGERLGRWSSGRGPLHALLAARLRRLIDEGELPARRAAAARPGARHRRSRSGAAPSSRPTSCCATTGGSSGARAAARGWPGRLGARPGSAAADHGRAGVPAPAGAARRGDPAGLRRPGPAAAGAGRGVRGACCPRWPRPPATSATTRAGHPALRRAIADRYTARGHPHRPRAHPGHQRRPAGPVAARPRLLVPGDRVLVRGADLPRCAGGVPRSRPPYRGPCRSGWPACGRRSGSTAPRWPT